MLCLCLDPAKAETELGDLSAGVHLRGDSRKGKDESFLLNNLYWSIAFYNVVLASYCTGK